MKKITLHPYRNTAKLNVLKSAHLVWFHQAIKSVQPAAKIWNVVEKKGFHQYGNIKLGSCCLVQIFYIITSTVSLKQFSVSVHLAWVKGVAYLNLLPVFQLIRLFCPMFWNQWLGLLLYQKTKLNLVVQAFGTSRAWCPSKTPAN